MPCLVFLFNFFFNSVPQIQDPHDKALLCVSAQGEGGNACAGDSGGPVVANKGGKAQLVGIIVGGTTFGGARPRCGDSGD